MSTTSFHSQRPASHRGCLAGGQPHTASHIPLANIWGTGRASSPARPYYLPQNPQAPTRTGTTSAATAQPSSNTNASASQSLLSNQAPSRTSSPAVTQSPKISRAPFRSQRRDVRLLLAVCLASACFGVTAWFAQATFSSTVSSRTRDIFKDVFKIDSGDTLTVLVLLSGVLGLLMGLVLDGVLESIQWLLTCRDNGVPMSTVLAVSGTTGSVGTLGIMCRSGSSIGARMWAAVK